MVKLISIEGLIGSGKSTFLEKIESLSDDIVVLKEPVNEWTNLKDLEGKNLIEHFYENKNKYSFLFQNYAFLSKIRSVIETMKKYENTNKIIVCERSIFTDYNVFAKCLYDEKFINEIEWNTYKQWFEHALYIHDNIKLDLIVYLDATIENCYDRIKERNRSGESEISKEYLGILDKYHKKWIHDNETPHINIDGNKNLKEDYELLVEEFQRVMCFLKEKENNTNTNVSV